MLFTRKRIIGLVGLLGAALVSLLAMPQFVRGLPTAQLAPVGSNLGIVCTESTDNVFHLATADGFISVPDGNSLYMWSFRAQSGSFQAPSPILCVNEGDTVTIHLTNNVAKITEPVSIIFPGQSGVTATGGTQGLLTQEAAPGGGTVSYTFVAEEPGTYLYESGTNQYKQVHMGLYGALIVRPALGANYAYNDASTEFDPTQEYLLLLHEIDPDLHRAAQLGVTYDVSQRHDRYWTINGRSMPDTLNDNFVAWLPNQPYSALVRVEALDPEHNANGKPALVRYANAGTFSHPFHPHGDHLRIVGQDGRFLDNASYDQFTRTQAAGQTADMLFTWENVESWTPGSGGAIPVEIPGLQNLIFKDGLSFYSGDVHLGSTGELPFGVTTHNQCGEFYYPWHSHALDEVQNFDEGFGGLMTLVRVDPPSSIIPCP